MAGSLAKPIAPIFGAYLLKTGGYVCVFTTTLVGTMLGAIVLVVMVRSYEWNPEKKHVNSMTLDTILVNDDLIHCTIDRKKCLQYPTSHRLL